MNSIEKKGVFHGKVHSKFNIQGAHRFRADVTDWIAASKDRCLVFVENIGYTRDQSRALARDYRRQDPIRMYITRDLTQTLRRRPSDLEVSHRVAELKDAEPETIYREKLLSDDNLFLYYFWETFSDTVKPSGIPIEFESHDQSVLQQERVISHKSSEGDKYATYLWRQGRYEEACAVIPGIYKLMVQAADLRNNSLASDSSALQSSLAQVDDFFLSFGTLHWPLSYLLGAHMELKLGIYPGSVWELATEDDADPSIVKERTVKGFYANRLTSEVAHYMMSNNRINEFFEHYEDYHLSTSQIVTGLTLEEIEAICKTKKTDEMVLERILRG